MADGLIWTDRVIPWVAIATENSHSQNKINETNLGQTINAFAD